MLIIAGRVRVDRRMCRAGDRGGEGGGAASGQRPARFEFLLEICILLGFRFMDIFEFRLKLLENLRFKRYWEQDTKSSITILELEVPLTYVVSFNLN